jgi:hypothetical protein
MESKTRIGGFGASSEPEYVWWAPTVSRYIGIHVVQSRWVSQERLLMIDDDDDDLHDRDCALVIYDDLLPCPVIEIAS